MGLKGLVVFNSAVSQMQDAAKNMEAIAEAKAKQEEAKVTSKLKNTVAEAQLEKIKADGKFSAVQAQVLADQLATKQKNDKLMEQGNDAAINLQEHSTMQQYKQADQLATDIHQIDPHVQSLVAQHVNPKLAVGPGGDTIMGGSEPDSYPEAPNPNPYQLKQKGRMMSYEQAPYKSPSSKEKKPSYNDVLKLATQMAKDDTSQAPTAERIKKHLPEAKRLVYNEQDPGEPFTQDKVYKQDTSAAGADAKKDKFGFVTGEEKEFSGRGKFKYIGDNKWQRQK